MLEAVVFEIIAFILVYIVYYYFILKRKYKAFKKGKNKKIYEQMEVSYLVSRFKIDRKKINLNLLRIIGIINAFIISFTGTFLYYIPVERIMWKFLIGFVIIFLLIYALYEILGKVLVKKGWKK